MLKALIIVFLLFYSYWTLFYLIRWFKINRLIKKFSHFAKASTNQELKPLITLMPQIKKFDIDQEVSHGLPFESNRFNAHSIFTLLQDKEPYERDLFFTSINPLYPLKMIFWLPSHFLKASGWVLKDGTAIFVNCLLAPFITFLATALVDLLANDLQNLITEWWNQFIQ